MVLADLQFDVHALQAQLPVTAAADKQTQRHSGGFPSICLQLLPSPAAPP
jgi:hypothetical protein